MAFANSTLQKKILILEQKDQYKHDRNWSFWINNHNKNFQHLDIIKQTWPSWRFSDASKSVTHTAHDHCYATIASDDFYKKAISIIQSDDRIDLCMNSTVKDCEFKKTESVFYIDTGAHNFTANKIIDTRNIGRKTIKDHASFYQIFFGYEIETTEDIFDTNCADMMNDMMYANDGFSFLYILPFSSRRALIEYTIFTSIFQKPETLKEKLHDILDSRFKNIDYKILHKEQAVLPMGKMILEKKIQNNNYFIAGGHSGALRESSGYGFLNIYNWANSAVNSLEQGANIPSANQSNPFMQFMDRHFIKTLKLYPHETINIFMAMANHMNADDFARFMNGNMDFKNIIGVINAVPKQPFLRALWN
jgi:lycopene beta-cyclase